MQLYEYTNLFGAYYNFTENSPCCCQSVEAQCNKDIEKLKCGFIFGILKYCDSVFTFCVEEECDFYDQVFAMPTVTFGDHSSDGFTLYSTLSHQGTTSKVCRIRTGIRSHDVA